MPARTPPFLIILARRPFRWFPCLEFTTDGDRPPFLAIAERLQAEFHGHVAERYGGHGPDDKEYWWIDLDSKRQLLMRKATPMGTGLVGNDFRDIELFEQIAKRFDARIVGWRFKLWRMMRRCLGPS